MMLYYSVQNDLISLALAKWWEEMDVDAIISIYLFFSAYKYQYSLSWEQSKVLFSPSCQLDSRADTKQFKCFPWYTNFLSEQLCTSLYRGLSLRGFYEHCAALLVLLCCFYMTQGKIFKNSLPVLWSSPSKECKPLSGLLFLRHSWTLSRNKWKQERKKREA